MTVKELIEKLKSMPKDARVLIKYDDYDAYGDKIPEYYEEPSIHYYDDYTYEIRIKPFEYSKIHLGQIVLFK